jgi:hypothetical protein
VVERLSLDATRQRLVVEIDLTDPDFFKQPFRGRERLRAIGAEDRALQTLARRRHRHDQEVDTESEYTEAPRHREKHFSVPLCPVP